MDLNARVDVNCRRKDGWMDGLVDGWTDGRTETGRLYHTLLKQMRQKQPGLNYFIKSKVYIDKGGKI